MQLRKYPLLVLLSLFLCSCGTGYQKEGDAWVWVTNDENFGERSNYIVEADARSFEVLSEKDFAKDKYHAYYRGKWIQGADPATFELLPEVGYSKDKGHVFLEKQKVIFANPASFELLEYPYARDDQYLFCGTLPIRLPKNELSEFKVTNEDKLMAGMRSTTSLAHFIELNPTYAWLDTLGIDAVIVGEWATGETSTKKFKGFTLTEK